MLKSFALFVVCVVAGANALCYDGSTAVANPNLNFCVEYRASACCATTSEQLLAGHLQSLNGTLGSGNCSENARRLGCAFICDPNNFNFVTPTSTSLTGNFTSFVVTSLYDSCKCVDDNGTIGDTYTTAIDFFTALNIPPQGPAPAVNFVNSSSAGAYNTTLLPASSFDTCMCGSGQPPNPVPGLSLCREYSQSSCCDTTTEGILINHIASLDNEFGTANCAENVRRVGCAFLCGPNNGAYVSMNFPTFRGNFSVTLTNGVYNSCKDRCWTGTDTFGQIYPNASSFMAALNVPAQGLSPAINFDISTSSKAYNGPVLSAAAADMLGCAEATTETSSASAVLVSYLFAAFIAVLLL